MEKCKTCGHGIAKSAPACPNCGAVLSTGMALAAVRSIPGWIFVGVLCWFAWLAAGAPGY